MALLAHLLGGGGEQQQAGDLGGQLLHAQVAGAAGLRMPIQVMRFVDDQQVETAGQGLFLTVTIGKQPALAGQHQLGALERIGAAVGLALMLVEQRDGQREAAQQLHQPLVGQAVGYQNQRALYAACQQQAVEDQTCFNGLAKPHFIGQQHPGGVAACDFVGDIELMGNQVDARPGKPQGAVLFDTLKVMQGTKTQVEPVVAVHLAGQQAVTGLVELHGVGQACFWQFAQVAVAVFTDVGDQATALFAVVHDHLPAVG